MQDSVIRPTNTTASKVVGTDTDKKLISVDLSDFISGTALEIEITDLGNGKVTVGIVTSPTLDGTNFSGIPDGALDESYILANGTRALTSNWDAGAYEIRALTFESDVVTGTAPLTIASTTVVTNLNVDQVDGYHLDQAVTSGSSPTFDGTNFTGIPDAALDLDYVEVAGDTMTGELIIDPSTGTNAIDCQKNITLKSGQKLIFDGT